MLSTNRRRFLQASATAGATLAMPAIVARAAGANERIRVGLIGLGGRMTSHVGSLAGLAKEADIVAICDCDEKQLATAEERYSELAGKKLKRFKDERALLDDKEIDAVSISTQDHWHALQTIWACQAGKDVYVEKPPTWCIAEGRKMVEAARKYQRMVQIGTQNRSSPIICEGMRKLREGVIGKLYMARGISYKPRGNLGKHRPKPAPQGLDWDKWVGPAEMVDWAGACSSIRRVNGSWATPKPTGFSHASIASRTWCRTRSERISRHRR